MISDTLSSGPAASSASLTTMHGAPAARVSTFAGAAASASSTHAPVAILSRVTCFAARLLGSASCGAESPAIGTGRGGMHAVASTGASSREVHNNIMVATRTISAAPARPHRTNHPRPQQRWPVSTSAPTCHRLSARPWAAINLVSWALRQRRSGNRRWRPQPSDSSKHSSNSFLRPGLVGRQLTCRARHSVPAETSTTSGTSHFYNGHGLMV